jgi:hypothetical protein
VAFLFEAEKLTWKRQPWQRQQPFWQHRQQRQTQQQLGLQQVREQQQEPVRVQERLLPSCHKQTEQQQR